MMPISTRAVRGAVLCVSMLLSFCAGAVTVPSESTEGRVLPTLRAVADELEATPSLQLDAQRSPLRQARIAPFLQRYGAQWKVQWDARSDRPNLVQGEGIALLPGRGNRLSAAHVGLAADRLPELDEVEAPARRLIGELEPVLQVADFDLRLDRDRSVPFGPERHHWFLEFGQYHEGLRVDGAFVFLRVSHGNVVQFGTERVAPVSIGAVPAMDRDAAFGEAWAQLAFPAGTRVAETLEAGELRVYPVLPAGEMLGEEYLGPEGYGYSHRYGWRFVFRVEGDAGTWQVLFDPATKKVFDLRDLNVNVDATLRGGVYPTTNTDPEISVTFPFAAITNNGAKVTDVDGVYDYSGGTATTSLDGRYFRMSDNCGSISLSNSTDGNLDLGSSGGTDCTTPGVGGAGNTHASRTGFYHLNLIGAKARSILPANTWLQTKVTANMNVNDLCNAGWNGTSVEFFRSGGGCSNTGEIAAVFLHEWGHGMDQNSGGAASENASGEAVGDTFAFLETRDSCIGPNFQPGVNCYNCTSCTGVRDVEEFSTRGPANRTIARPNTVTDNAGINCDRFACPYSVNGIFPYRGPMGYQGHCESHISSGATWDLTQSLVERHGEEGWGRMDRIWYSSLVPSKSAYQVASGGTCNPNATVNGCGATNWYPVFLAADDDDGNLANGTPDACRIWDAFDAHGIACGERPVCTDDGPDFRLAVNDSPQRVCAGDVAQFGVEIGSNLGFANPVTLAVSGLPGASTAQFSPNPVTPVGDSVLEVAVDAAVASGTYTLTVSGTADGSDGHSRNASLQVDASAPAAAVLAAPAANAIGTSLAPVLSWQAIAGASGYRVEVARDAAFTDIVASADDITTTSWTPPALEGGQVYYWRVGAGNSCGAGAMSAVRAFTTASGFEYCRTPAPAISIPDNNMNGVNDSLTIPAGTPISNLRLKLQINHTYVGDLIARLSRGATSVIAIDRPGVPGSANGCSGDNIDVTLDDSATSAVESACAGGVPTISGVLRPNNPLTTPFLGSDAGGTWTLNVADRASQDTGSIARWCVENLNTVPSYGVGGSVDGLEGSGLVLQLNGGETIAVAADGGFAFVTRLLDGADYEVSILTQPDGAECEVLDGEGAIDAADVDSIEVVCSVDGHRVSGVLAGLVGGEIDLTLNGTRTITLDADGPFMFPSRIAEGGPIQVELTRQTEALQRCTLSGAEATMQDADYDDLRVDCEALPPEVFADGFEP